MIQCGRGAPQTRYICCIKAGGWSLTYCPQGPVQNSQKFMVKMSSTLTLGLLKRCVPARGGWFGEGIRQSDLDMTLNLFRHLFHRFILPFLVSLLNLVHASILVVCLSVCVFFSQFYISMQFKTLGCSFIKVVNQGSIQTITQHSTCLSSYFRMVISPYINVYAC